MNNKEFLKKIKFEEGIDKKEGLMIDFNQPNSEKVYVLFVNHGYEIVLNCAWAKVFTIPEKAKLIDKNGEPELTVGELEQSLDKIERLGLKEIFNKNVSLKTMKMSFVERVEWLVKNNLPYLNGDDTFIEELFDKEKMGEYSKSVSIDQITTTKDIEPSMIPQTEAVLDSEDLIVKAEIIKSLTEINQENDNMTLKFIISSIITNIDDAIARDNKNYRLMGTRHIIEDALQGFNMTSEIEDLVQNKILSKFTLSEEIQMGRLA